MTVYLLTGTPGSGKSLAMAKNIYWHVKTKRPVVANFEINRELFKDSSSFYYCPNEALTPGKLEEFARWYWSENGGCVKEDHIRLYIDEAQVIFSNRQWSKNTEWVRFFSQHRKFGYEVHIIAQYDEMIDKQIRALVEYQIMHRKLNNVGKIGRFVNLVLAGIPVIVRVMYWYPMKMRLSSEWTIGTRKYFRLYDTFKTFQSS